MEPVLQKGEEVIVKADGAFNGRFNQTFITNLGLHLISWGDIWFVPFTNISGVLLKTCGSSSYTVEFYEGKKKVSGINMEEKTADKIRAQTLENRLKSFPNNGATEALDEAKLVEIIARCQKTATKGLIFGEHVRMLPEQGVSAIERFLGEEVRFYGGKHYYLRGLYENPEFISRNWIIEIKEAGFGKYSQPLVTAVYRPDIVFWDAKLRFKQVTIHEAGTRGGPFSTGSPGGTSTDYVLMKEFSSTTLYTPYNKKNFSPFKIFGFYGSDVSGLAKEQ